MSRLNNNKANLTQGNVNTHIFTEFSDMAKEETQKQVLDAIKNINLNVGEIVVGDITVESSDTVTHTKLDTLNNTVSNKHLNKLTDSIDISGQTITIHSLNTVAQQSTLSNINQNIPQMESDNDNRLKVNTEGQSINIGNTVPVTGSVIVSSGSISVSNFPSNQQVFGSVNVSNMISGFSTEATALNIKSAIDNKHLNSVEDSVSVAGSVSISNFPTTQIIQGTVAISNALTLDTTTQSTNNKLDTVNTNIGTTNTKLDTLNNTIINKTLDKSTSSIDISGQSVNVNTISGFALESTSQTLAKDTTLAGVSSKLDVLTNINENLTPNYNAVYDLAILGSTLWADSSPGFTADIYGNRNGWYYFNQNNASNKSNIYWYSNTGIYAENNMAFSSVSTYAIITCDFVDNGSLTIPTIGIFSKPTGTNDFMPGFAHSRWVYQMSVSDISKLRKGETIILNVGTYNGIERDLPIYNLVLASASGDASPTEIIGNISINTQGTTSSISYLLQYTGYYNSVLGINREFTFDNSRERIALEKEASGVISGSVSVSNMITGYALENGNLADIKTNSDKLKYVGDDLKAVISNTGFNVNNQITGFALENGGNLADIKTNSDKLKYVGDDLKTVISNQISGYALENGNLADIKTNSDKLKYVGDDLKAVISNTGFNVNNQITGFALENGNLADIKTNSDKLKYVNDDLKAVISNTGFNCNNQITGYATETTLDDIRYKTNLLNFYNENGIDELMTYDRASETNLIQIKTNSDKLKYVGDDLKAVISNTGFNVNNQITGYALENDGNLADIKTNSDKLKYVGDDLKVIISNTGFNCNNQISGYATEVTLADIKGKTDNLTFDGSSNLNVNVAAGSISVESVNIKDSAGNNLNSTSNALNSYITNSSINTHIFGKHSSGGGPGGFTEVKVSNDGEVICQINNTVPISGSVSLTDGTDTADITPTISANLAGNKALVCDSVLYGYNSSTGHIQNITLTYDGATHNMLDVNDALGNTNLEALNDKANTLNTLTAGQTAVIGEVRDNTATTNTKLDTVNSSIGTSNSTLSTIDGKLSTTTYNSLTGLNVYQIYPQTINYLWSGQQSSGIQNVVMFGGGAALTASSFNIGSNNLKNFNIHHNGTGTKYANVDYVDSSGNLQTLTNQAITTNTSTVYISNAINVNRISWGSLSSNETSTELRVRDNVHTTSNRNIVSSFNVAQPIITVPNGYKGVIKNINIYVANGGDCHLYIRDANNNHKSTLYFANMSGAFPATPPYSGGQFPTKNYTLNLPLDALDSCYMVGLPASGGTFIFSGNVEITKI
jgi:uncharacterized protein (UPF0297 family)